MAGRPLLFRRGRSRSHLRLLHHAAGAADGVYKPLPVIDVPVRYTFKVIQNIYLPMGFSNFKIEGRGLGSALILEFLLYYMTKPEYQLRVREEIYLNNMLDLF